MLKYTVPKRNGNLTPNYTKMHYFTKTFSYKLNLGSHDVKRCWWGDTNFPGTDCRSCVACP
jgi:hypothetical protein